MLISCFKLFYNHRYLFLLNYILLLNLENEITDPTTKRITKTRSPQEPLQVNPQENPRPTNEKLNPVTTDEKLLLQEELFHDGPLIIKIKINNGEFDKAGPEIDSRTAF